MICAVSDVLLCDCQGGSDQTGDSQICCIWTIKQRPFKKKKKSVSESQVPQILLSHPTNRTEGLARLAESAAGTKPCSNTHVKSVNSCYQTALKGFSAAGHTSVAAAALGASLGHGLRLVALGGFCQASRL